MESTVQHKPSRRRLLKQLGAAGLAMGFSAASLQAMSLLPQDKRVVFVYIPGGAPPEQWMPSGSADRFTLGPASAPLDSVKQHCVFFDGINIPRSGPCAPRRALGNPPFGSETIDVKLGRHLQGGAAHANLFLSTEDVFLGSLTDFGPSREYEPEPWNYYRSNPVEAYLELFSGDLNYIDRRFPGIAKGFDIDPAAVGCGHFDATARLNIELASLALHLDKTRAVTLMLGDSYSHIFAPESGALDYDYAQAMHSRSLQDYVNFRAYLTRKVAYLIQLLQSMPDKNGQSLLDNTLVVQIADTGDGRGHEGSRVPFMLAGGRNFIRNGLYLKGYGDASSVLDTASSVLGLPEARLGQGPIAELVI